MASILRSAQEYHRLRNIKYRILVGSKGTLRAIELSFNAKGYRHLVGLQYMKNIANVESSEILLKMILEGEISDEKVRSHENYDSIKSRIEIVSNLESFLDGDLTYFEFRKKDYTRINADILALGKFQGKDAVYFAISSDSGTYTPVTIICDGMTDYTYQQKRYSTLYCDKLNSETNEIVILKPCKHQNIKIEDHFDL